MTLLTSLGISIAAFGVVAAALVRGYLWFDARVARSELHPPA